MIVVDTSVLSAAYRPPPRNRERTEEEGRQERERNVLRAALADWLKTDEEVVLPGVVRQELLSGVRSAKAFDSLRFELSRFAVVLADVADHDEAAAVFNSCAAGGVAAKGADCLVAAMTIRRGARLLAGDKDFKAMGPFCNLSLIPLPGFHA